MDHKSKEHSTSHSGKSGLIRPVNDSTVNLAVNVGVNERLLKIGLINNYAASYNFELSQIKRFKVNTQILLRMNLFQWTVSALKMEDSRYRYQLFLCLFG